MHQLLDCLLADHHLLEAGQAGAMQGDVPILLAPVMFEGSVPWKPECKVCVRVGAAWSVFTVQEITEMLRRCRAASWSCGPENMLFFL